LRQSNKELLQTLRIGQKKAWDILNQAKGLKSKPIKSKAAYTCSTPTKVQYSTPTKAQYLSLLGDEGNTKVLKSLDNTAVLNSSNYGRPHKTPTRSSRPLLNMSSNSEPHSPLCSENHRAKLNTQLNKSYTQLADDLRRLAPYCSTSSIENMTRSADSSTLSAKPESYYDEMRRFRLAHSAECSVKLPDERTLIEEHEKTVRSTEETTVDASAVEQPHQCIQTYTVGHGYRADDDHSCEQCPLCVGADDTKLRGLIRVNIPESETVQYDRKLNFNPDSLDSLGLSKHCAAGWKQSRTQYKVPTIPSFGYKAACAE